MQNKQDRQRTAPESHNLAEYPLALISDRPSKSAPLIRVIEDRGKRWEMKGSPSFGLPTAQDVEVYLVLAEYSQAFDLSREIPFSRYLLLDRLGWGFQSSRYQRLSLSLSRWRHTTYTTTGCIQDPKTGRWRQTVSLEIISYLDLWERADRSQKVPERPSSFAWNPVVAAHLNHSAYHHNLDLGLFLSLENGVAQAEYRYLATRLRQGQSRHEEGLQRFSSTRLGLAPTRPCHIKRLLDPAHAELIARGVLIGAEYGHRADGEEKLIFHPNKAVFGRSGKPAERPQAPATPPPAPVPTPESLTPRKPLSAGAPAKRPDPPAIEATSEAVRRLMGKNGLL